MPISVENPNAEIVAIGTEILLGEITDTNSVYIARSLRDIGVNLYYMTTVGDNRQRIADALRLAQSRAQIVITCGGLGPTIDDMTRQAVADATDRELVFDQSLLDEIARRFNMYRVQMTENNRRQAYLPADAHVINNPVGTAPSFMVEHNGGMVISLPGVPREMKFLMDKQVTPMLRQRYRLGIIKARILRTAGIGESTLDDMIGTDLLEMANPTIGLAAHSGQVDIRITAKANSDDEATRMLVSIEETLRTRVGRFIFGYDKDKLEDIVGAAMRRHNTKIALIEVGTRGVIAQKLEKTINDVILSKAIHDSPQKLFDLLDTEDKTLSLRELATQTARTLSQTGDNTIGIVVISDPEINEGADRDEATAIAVAYREHERSRVYGFGGQSDLARNWLANWALSSAWGMLPQEVTSDDNIQS